MRASRERATRQGLFVRAGDTIVAVASAPGRGARAMVRVSGPGTVGLVRSLLSGAAGGARGNGCGVGVLRLEPHPPSAIREPQSLPVLFSVYQAPHSYTGEDAAEIQAPGNPVLVERVVAALTSREGVRLAEAGEFTARAYLAGKMTLSLAEGVAATVAASSDEQLDAARALLEGRAGEEYRRWADELTTLLALVESGIDFTDQEDVVPIAPVALLARIEELRRELTSYLGGVRGRESAGALAKVVLVGMPNAGKSTLFNALLGRRRAVTSPTAGTTRDVLTEELNLARDVPGAGVVLLEDLAGLDVGRGTWDVGCEGTASAVDAASQEAAERAVREADVLVWCDPAGRFEGVDVGGARVIRVRTFADRPRVHEGREELAVCALDGWHLAALRRAIAEATTTSRAAGVAALLPRHRGAMGEAAARLTEAGESVGAGARLASPEVTATALRGALDALGELVGQISPDEVLGRVFATFCVGK